MTTTTPDLTRFRDDRGTNGDRPRPPDAGGFTPPRGALRRLVSPIVRMPRRVANWLKRPKARDWLQRKAVTTLMNLLIFAAAAVTAVTAGLLADPGWPDPTKWGAGALKLFALWCLAFLPGWLYVRFLDLRAESLWFEYVLNLHRLGWDRHWLLPEPPAASEYHELWDAWPTQLQGPRPTDTIYQRKFEAYYGRVVPRMASQRSRGRPGPGRGEGESRNSAYQVNAESLFPVFMSTAIFAVGWAAVLWDTGFIIAPTGPWDVLKYAFIGSYAFVISMLIRRYFQSDLRPSAYASGVYRIILVLLVIVVLHQVFGPILPSTGHSELAVAFMIGFFPLVGLQALQRITSKTLRKVVPPVTSEYPLDQLDGFNLWYEARLIEEGVEDMQNLTTMNLVDVILHTRVPTGRLVDWIDQAFLLTHLDSADRSELNERREALDQHRRGPDGQAAGNPRAGMGALDGADARLGLRRFGVRTATDLLKMFSVEVNESGGNLTQRVFRRPIYLDKLPLPVDQLRLLVTVLSAEPGLAPVWNWQRNGVQSCRHTQAQHCSKPAAPTAAACA
jgi:hypothetical protein